MAAPTTHRPTLDQVAAAAGVSKATASKVLNGRPHISAETRAKVEQAIARLGYVPSTGPRLPGDTLAKVAVVFRTLSDIYNMRVLEGIVASAHAQEIEVIVEVQDVSSGPRSPLTPGWLRHQAARQRTGIIVVTSELSGAQRSLLRSLGLAAVHIDPVNPMEAETISVGSTNFAGGMQATQHLVDLGHRRIAFAGGPVGSMPNKERYHGYLSTLAAAGITADPALALMREHRFDAGLEMATAFLTSQHPPTAIFAGSDSSALGVLEAARRLGMRVPQDLSLVGFDDTYAATSSAPALTTVRQPIVEMGRVALQTLLQLSRGDAVDNHHVQLSTQLVVRESTAPPAPLTMTTPLA